MILFFSGNRYIGGHSLKGHLKSKQMVNIEDVLKTRELVIFFLIPYFKEIDDLFILLCFISYIIFTLEK